MKVLLDCRMAEWSGVGRYTRGLVSGLIAEGVVSLVLVTASDSHGLFPGARTVPAQHSPFSLAGMVELAAIIRREQPDVVHCLHFPTPTRSPVPIVVTLHDVTPLVVDSVMPSATRRLVYRALTARAVRLAKRVIAPSAATQRDLARLFPASAGRSIVVPEAADDFASGEVAPDPGVDRPYVLSMGNTKAHKDLPTLFAAFDRVAQDFPDMNLVLTGEEPAGYIDARVPFTSRKRVSFTGEISDVRLRSLYANATVFAFPSRYEGFGLPPLEAMALGAPVITTTAASLPEVVGDAAILVPPGDVTALTGALAKLLGDEKMREALIEKGRLRAASFSWRQTAQLTVAVYRDAADES